MNLTVNLKNVARAAAAGAAGWYALSHWRERVARDRHAKFAADLANYDRVERPKRADTDSARARRRDSAWDVLYMRKVTRHDLDKVMELYAKVFYTTPSYAFMFPDESTRLDKFKWLMSRRVRILLRAGGTIVGAFVKRDDKLKLVGLVGLLPRGATSTMALLESGLLMWPFLHGMASLKRMFELLGKYDGEFDQMERDLRKQNAHVERVIEVSMMAVDDEVQGQGVGSTLFRFLFELYRRESAPGVADKTAFVLATQKPINVEFYKRHGFHVMRHEVYNEGTDNAWPDWAMAKVPKKPAE